MTKLTWLLMAAHVPADGAGGGMVRYVVELASALHRRDDVEVHVTASPSASQWWRTRLGDSRVHEVADLPQPAASLRDLGRSGLPRDLAVDVIHGAKHLLPLRRSSALRVLTVHDMLPLDRPRDFGRAKRLFLRRPYLHALRSADVLLCVSAATRSRLLSYVPQAIDRAEVVPLAAARSLLDAEPRPVPELHAGRFILTVGDNSPRKNQAMLAAAWQRIAPLVPDAKLAVAGPAGWGVSDGEAHAAGLVRLGHLTDQQLAWCYRHAAAVAAPSLLEGFGLTAAEALALGAPLITSDDAALAEASGRTAMVVSSSDMYQWARVMLSALLTTEGTGDGQKPPARTWEDVAADTVRAARERLLRAEGEASRV